MQQLSSCLSSSNTKNAFILGIAVWILSIAPAYATATTTVYYQPTPYPIGDENGIHITDGWLPSVYYGQVFRQDTTDRVAGWGDQYLTFVKFDTNGLPLSVASATLEMMPYNTGGNVTDAYINLVTSSWDQSTMSWYSQPSVSYLGTQSAPTYGVWWNNDITDQYNDWLSGATANYGLRIDPVNYNNNDSDIFHSSQYTDDDSQRPLLELQFVPPVEIPDFKLPLPGDLSWLVTTEPGGWDCKTTDSQDPAHTWKNFFSVDFTDVDKDSGGDPDYDFTVGGNSTTSIPVIAAADGTVVTIGTDANVPNGYYIVLNNSGGNDENTGFTTRYLHLEYPTTLSLNDTVSQGDFLGYMGATGTTTGTNLHFGIRYDGIGESTSTVSYVTMENLLLKSYQTECDDTDSNFIRYYPSSNTTY